MDDEDFNDRRNEACQHYGWGWEPVTLPSVINRKELETLQDTTY